MYLNALIVSLCMCGLRYTYARDVSIGCITATDAAALKTPLSAPSTGEPGDKIIFLTSASLAMDCTVKFTLEPSMSLITLAPTPLYNVFHPSLAQIFLNATIPFSYSHIAAGTCIRVLIKSNGLLDTAPIPPLRHPAMNRFHAGAGLSSSVCITFSTGKNSPIRNTFFDDSRTIATGKPLYSPRSAPSFFTIFIVTSRMFSPHDAPTPGSCMIVFARSIGFVASTARQDASAEFGMATQPGNCSLFVFRVTASRLGSVSVLRRFGDDALDIALARARRSRASDAVEGIARAARASGEKAVRVFRWRALALGAG